MTRVTLSPSGSPHMSRRPALLAASLLLAATGLLVPAAHAAGPSYVALGDSYSSGTGTRTYLADGTSCQRSVYAYPSLIAAARTYSLNFRACSGAKVADVTNTQLSALSASTSYVTISVGGNDAGFAERAHHLRPAELAEQLQRRDRQGAGLHHHHPPGLGAHALRRDPQPGAPAPRWSWSATRGSSTARTATPSPGSPRARRPGSTRPPTCSTASSPRRPRPPASPTPTRPRPFVGHAVCDNTEWLNGLSNPVSESYHPNRTGHSAGYTPLVSPRLTGAAVVASAAVLRLGGVGRTGAGPHAAGVRRARTPPSSRRRSSRPT